MKHTCLSLFATTLWLSAGSVCLAQTASLAVKMPASEPTTSASSIQTARIRGVVKGPKGPLPGAVIQANGTNALTVSSAEGKFELEVPTTAPTVVLTCSYVGLADEVVKVPANATSTVIQLLRPVQRTEAEPVLESGWW